MTPIKYLLVWLWFTCMPFSACAYADETSREYQIKAGYLYNFTKFITWPEEISETFNLCILGDDPFGEIIDPIEQRNVADHPIKVVRLPYSRSHTDITKFPLCHILYISPSFKETGIYQKLHNVLTIGETDQFAAQGGMIGFQKQNDRVTLQINLSALKQSGLKVSAKLLEVSEIVSGDGHVQ
jgi:hypothetical protein